MRSQKVRITFPLFPYHCANKNQEMHLEKKLKNLPAKVRKVKIPINKYHCMKSVQIGTRKNSVFGHFSRSACQINPFQPSAAFHIEITHLIRIANQMTGFYMKCNTGNGLNKTFFLITFQFRTIFHIFRTKIQHFFCKLNFKCC